MRWFAQTSPKVDTPGESNVFTRGQLRHGSMEEIWEIWDHALLQLGMLSGLSVNPKIDLFGQVSCKTRKN